MWKRSFSTEIKGTPQQVWDIWSDVSQWSSWDSGITSSRLDGAFENGAKGELKPKSGPKAQWVLSDVKPREAFTNKARLPLGTLEFSHQLTAISDNHVRVTHSIQLSGALTFLFKHLIGKPGAADIPAALANIKTRIETAEQSRGSAKGTSS